MDWVEGDLVITITARYDYKDTLLSYSDMDKISHHVDTDHNASVDVRQSGNWSNSRRCGQEPTTSRAYIAVLVQVGSSLI